MEPHHEVKENKNLSTKRNILFALLQKSPVCIQMNCLNYLRVGSLSKLYSRKLQTHFKNPRVSILKNPRQLTKTKRSTLISQYFKMVQMELIIDLSIYLYFSPGDFGILWILSTSGFGDLRMLWILGTSGIFGIWGFSGFCVLERF